MPPELVIQAKECGLQLDFRDLHDRAGILVAEVLPAYKIRLFAAVFSEGCAAFPAAELCAQRVDFPCLADLSVFDAALPKLLHRVEGLLIDDGFLRPRRVILFALAVVSHLFGGKLVRRVLLLPEGIADVSLIGKDVRDRADRPAAVAFFIYRYAVRVQALCDFQNAVSRQVLPENPPHGFGLIRNHDDFPVLDPIAVGHGAGQEGAAR